MKHCITCISCIIIFIGDTLGTDDTILNKLNRYISYLNMVKYLLTLFVFCTAYSAQAQLRLDSVLSLNIKSMGGSNLILQRDSIYYLSEFDCAQITVYSGTWHLNKDTLILMPATDTNWSVIKRISYIDRGNDTLLRIYVKDSYGHNIDTYNPWYFYYDNEMVYDNIISNDGYFSIPVNTVKEFTYSYYSFNKYVDKAVTVTDKDVEIIFNPPANMLYKTVLQKTFTHTEKYIIKKDGLYYIDNPIERAYVY